jgi:hypothetical protein
VADEQREPTQTEEGIEVEIDVEVGDLRLSCGQAKFESLRRAICVEVGLEDVVEGIERIRYIEIESSPPTLSAFKMAVARLTCWVVIGALAIILMAGTATVFNWLGRIFR